MRLEDQLMEIMREHGLTGLTLCIMEGGKLHAYAHRHPNCAQSPGHTETASEAISSAIAELNKRAPVPELAPMGEEA